MTGIESFRKEMIYLDHASLTPAIPAAVEAFRAAPFGNPSSEHGEGQKARYALEQAREQIARLLGCTGRERIVFTSTATEAAALVSYSLAENGIGIAPDETEHHAILENEDVFPYKPEGCWPGLCAARMYANNETGAILRERPDISNYQTHWLCDATAAVGHIPVSFEQIGCDALIADSIKFGGFPGAALLIADADFPLIPLIRGGGQERGYRSGTENVPAICAMAAALEWNVEHMEENQRKLSNLTQILITLLSKIPGVRWNTPLDKPRLPHILNLSFEGVDAHALTLLLSREGVMISAGAACSNGKNEPSHVIMAMYHDEQRAREAVRLSLSHQNTEAEIWKAAHKIAEAVDFLRSLN